MTTTLAATPPHAAFRCPGDSYEISRAVHLGRLASFHAACQQCPHRHDVQGLPDAVAARVRQAWPTALPPLFDDGGLAGIGGEVLTPAVAHRAAMAFGLHLRDIDKNQSTPTVVLAGDERPLAAELVAAAGDGLRYGGCCVIDLGAATAACLAQSVLHRQADGGLLVGNRLSQPRTASLSFWAGGAAPLSAGLEQCGPSLEAVQSLFHREPARPTRRSGGWQRGSGESQYLDGLRLWFHALRPLRFSLDTGCRPLRRYLDRLLENVACQAIYPGSSREQPGQSLHFRLWIDGDGGRCRLHDERGDLVAWDSLLALLGQHLLRETGPAVLVAEEPVSPVVAESIGRAGGKLLVAGPAQAAMHTACCESQAIVGGGPSGRFWFGGQRPVADVLRLLALLLNILSQSDRPLSEVVRRALGRP